MESPPERRTETQKSKSLPDSPGLWTRIDVHGARRVHRVISQNGELYAKVGWLLPVAVPVGEMPGAWDRID